MESNTASAVRVCAAHGAEVWGVTKVMRGDPRLASAMLRGGAAGLCDSRLDNIAAMRAAGIDAPIMLIRVPMPSELRRAATLADVILMSELVSIRSIDCICAADDADVDIILMVDMGDRREGMMPDELIEAARSLRDLRRARVVGVGANFACASGVLPARRKLDELVALRDAAAIEIGRAMPVISIGGSTCLKLAEDGDLHPAGVHLRIGEAIVAGSDTSRGRYLPYMRSDGCTASAEVVECRTKPSLPDGETGSAAGGLRPVFEDIGPRRRALLALGRQDAPPEKLLPLDEGVVIKGASGDHMIADVTEHERRTGRIVAPGDVIELRPLYPAVLSMSTSPYVKKIFF